MVDHDVSRRDILKTTGGAVGVAGLAGSGAASGVVEVNVGYSSAAGRSAALEAAADVKREFKFDAMTIRVATEAVPGLRSKMGVRYVEQNGTMHALDQTTPYGIEKVEADLAIDDGETGDGVSIAILDTGIDAQHETLEENLGEGWATDDAACTTDCGGGPFGGGNNIGECLEEWDDDNDHGSHCAGTAAAADNGVGVLGVAPDATLHAVKVLACDGSGSFDDIAAGIEWSADQGHDVQSMSLGADSGSDVVDDAIAYAVDRNVVLVAAAGNDGPCSDCVGYPARHPEVIAVSATDENDDLADFSSTGPEVELAAPGVDTLSTVPRDDYDEFSGTSMACPHVSGGAASVIASGVTDRGEVRATLKDAADDIGLGDNEQGAGRLNVADAVDADGSGGDDEEDDGDDTTDPVDPSVDDVTARDESSGGRPHADVAVDWSVSDDDGDLDSVLTEVYDDGGSLVDDATTSVSGDTATGTDEFRINHGRGDSYEAVVTVTDTGGREDTGSDTVQT